jgi:hypothetical protein
MREKGGKKRRKCHSGQKGETVVPPLKGPGERDDGKTLAKGIFIRVC